MAVPANRFLRWLVVAGICLPVAGLALFGFLRTRTEMMRQSHERREAVARLSATLLDEKFDRLRDVALSLAGRVRMRELVAEGRWKDAVAILQDVPADLPYVDRIFLADPAGVLRADVPEVASVHGKSFAHRDWYRGVSAGWNPYVSDIYVRAAEPAIPVVAVAVPLRRAGSESVLGILVLQVATSTVLSWGERLDAAPEAAVCFLDRQGQAIQWPPDAGAEHVRDFSSWIGFGESGVRVVPHPAGGEELLAAFASVPGHGWTIAAIRTRRSAFEAMHSTLLFQSVFYAGALAVAAALGVAVIRAMDRRLAAELAVWEVNERLVAANKDLDAFTYSVSHDLRAPLRAISGFCQILQEDCAPKLDDEGKRCLGVVVGNAAKMARLIDDLLAFSRMGRLAVQASRVDMSAMAHTVFDELRRGESDGVEFRLSSLPAARGDSAMLRQVWSNLLSNALKYSRGRRPAVIEVGGIVSDGEVRYVVKDNGAGFDMRYADKLFGVFQRLHAADEFEGTGVGLALVQRIVSKHGGRVGAEGKVGEGATFWFTLPAQA